MPIYEYKCAKCGHALEEIRKEEWRDEPIDCEKCRGPAKRVEISKSHFHLKGGDWHDTKGGVR
jgi:putative FmdB family regulatory protein